MVDAERLQRLIAQLQARAQPALRADLVPLRVGGRQVGRAQPAVARFIARNIVGFGLTDGALVLADDALDSDARTALLAKAALKLREAGMIGGWRDELLNVGNPAVATIERAACRSLGITTEAVHINAYADSETMIVARRAAHKQIDAGLWDNLVGGMVSAGETLYQTLEREAWEEAGLRVDPASLERGRCFQMMRPVPEGMQSEVIHVYDMRVPGDATLKNQDGEVDAIERRTLNEVITAIENDEFTLESALVTLESVSRRAQIDTPPDFFHFDYETSSIQAI